ELASDDERAALELPSQVASPYTESEISRLAPEPHDSYIGERRVEHEHAELVHRMRRHEARGVPGLARRRPRRRENDQERYQQDGCSLHGASSHRSAFVTSAPASPPRPGAAARMTPGNAGTGGARCAAGKNAGIRPARRGAPQRVSDGAWMRRRVRGRSWLIL